jgi:arylsulfatase A
VTLSKPPTLSKPTDYELSTSNMFQEAWIPAIKEGGYRNFQLFNLKEDPNQTNDRAASQPERVERMKEKLLKISAGIMVDGADWHMN